MKNKNWFSLVILVLLFNSLSSFGQLETRLATNCAIDNIQIPINVKNLENIKSFQLKLLFDDNLLRLDTNLYHYAGFEINENIENQISVSASNDTLTILWGAYYGVSLDDELLLSLVFSEIGIGTASFTWIEDECFFKDALGLNIETDYIIDADITLPYNSAVTIDFEQFTIGCRDNSEDGGCKAQAEVNIIGGVQPYEYKWFDRFNQNDSVAIGLCQDPVNVIIRDANNCIYPSQFDAVIYPAAVYEIKADPEEIYITTPIADFEIITDDEYIESYLWDFGDEKTETSEFATHIFTQVGTYNVSLRTENIDGCDTIVTINNFEVKELNFCIPNVFTPNGDNINDTWIFKIIGAEGTGETESSFKKTGYEDVKKCSGDDLIFQDHFQASNLVVLNRSGSSVYECNNCTEYWDGGNLPDGVYFYVFTWEGLYSKGVEQGNVTILGSQNK